MRVRIPMPGGAESLNAGVAAGVVLYEAAAAAAEPGGTAGLSVGCCGPVGARRGLLRARCGSRAGTVVPP